MSRGSRARNRNSDDARIARSAYNAQPQVRQRRAIERAIKKHMSPPMIQMGYGNPVPKMPKRKGM